MAQMPGYERRVHDLALARLEEEPLLLLQGPRTVGKTYLLHQLAEARGGEVIDLDDPPTRDAVRTDAATLVSGSGPIFIDEYQHEPAVLAAVKAELNNDLRPEDPPTRHAVRTDAATLVSGSGPIFIDEYQHEPAVLAAVKAELNNDLRPGRFVLAGSTRSTAVPEVAEYLAGRVSFLAVLPLSQGEIEGARENFVETLMLGEPRSLVTNKRSETSRVEYARQITTGGMPIALARNEPARRRWFDEYVELVLERGVMEVSKLRQRRQLPALLRHLPSQTGQLLNITVTAEAAVLDRHTAADYLELLESVFLVRQLPAWGRTLGARTTGTPKVHLEI